MFEAGALFGTVEARSTGEALRDGLVVVFFAGVGALMLSSGIKKTPELWRNMSVARRQVETRQAFFNPPQELAIPDETQQNSVAVSGSEAADCPGVALDGAGNLASATAGGPLAEAPAADSIQAGQNPPIDGPPAVG